MKRETWIVVADGAHARILQNQRKTLEVLVELSDAHLPNRDLVSDRPGRVHDRVGPARHSMTPEIDTHRQNKRRLMREIARLVNEAAHRERFDDLVLVAAPAALGDLRAELGAQAAKRVTAEVAKDLTHLPARELRKRLAPELSIRD